MIIAFAVTVAAPVATQEVTLPEQLALDITERIRTLTPTTKLNAASVCELVDINRDLLQSALDVLTNADSSIGDTSRATMYMSAVTANAAVIDGLIADARTVDPAFRCYNWNFED